MNDTIYEIHRKRKAEVKVVEVDIDSDSPADAIVAMLEQQGEPVARAESFTAPDGHTYVCVYAPARVVQFEPTAGDIAKKRKAGSETIQSRQVFRVDSKDPLRVIRLSSWSSDIFPPHLQER